MTQFASDSFTGTDGAELHAYAASWIKQSGVTGDNQLISNRVRASTTTSAAYYYNTAPAGADYSASVDVYVASVSGSGTRTIGPCVRMDPAASTEYHTRITDGSGSFTLDLYKFVSGAATLLGNASITCTAGNTYNVKIEAIGTTINAYFNGAGSPTVTATDSSITAAGYAGIRGFNANAPGDSIGLHIDNFSADQTGGGTSVAPGVGSVAITGFAPTISQTAGFTLTPGVGSVALTGYVPTLVQTANQAIAVVVGSIAIAGFAPVVSQTGTDAGWLGGAGHKRKKWPEPQQTAEQVRQQRMELGIVEPDGTPAMAPAARKIISQTAQKVLAPEISAAQAQATLRKEMERRQIAFRQEHANLLLRQRDEMRSRSIVYAAALRRQRQEDDEIAAHLLL